MKAPGVYVLYGPDDACLYVGSSKNMENRASMHAGKGFTRVEYRPCSADIRRQEEYKAIAELRPLLNKNNNPNAVSRRGTPVQFSLNGDDKRLLLRLQKKLAGIGKTSILRLALRALDEKLAA